MSDREGQARDGVAVVSLSPLATRFLLAIGAGSQLVAIDAVSAAREGFPELPVVELADVSLYAPDLVLLPQPPDPEDPVVTELAARGVRVLEFAPHDFEDVLLLIREIGSMLVGSERASRFEFRLSRPLAKIGGSSRGQPRPRVVAVVSLDPLVIAGGHSFETDLIEIAGGRSVTHPGEENRLSLRADQWQDLAPELVLVIAERPASERAERALRNALPAGPPVAFFPLEPAFWLDDPIEPAGRLRALIESVGAPSKSPAKP